MRASVARSSMSSSYEAHEGDGRWPSSLQTEVDHLPQLPAGRDDALRDAWDALRWTRRAVLTNCMDSSAATGQFNIEEWCKSQSTVSTLHDVKASKKKCNMRHRVELHVQNHKDVRLKLQSLIEQTRAIIAQLEAVYNRCHAPQPR